MILKYLYIFIILSLFLIIFIPSKKLKLIQNLSLLSASVSLLVSLYIFIYFNSNTIKFQFLYESDFLSLNFLNIDFIFGLDGISIYFFLLTAFLTFLCILFVWDEKKFKEYAFLLIFLELLLFLTFSVLNLFLFYIFFEFILIPIYLIIGIWGSREKKIRASYLLFFYTLCGSLPLLMSILYIDKVAGNCNFEFLINYTFSFEEQVILWLSFFLSFASKIPLFPLHIWLPEAHVEAPTVGSVLLAGILLKLGVYGFLRYSVVLFPLGSIYFSPLLYTLGVAGIIYASFAAIKQTDLKKIIAYSSIAHMNLVVLGIFSNNIMGMEASILQSISHGFVSSALFFLIGILYKKYHSRSLYYFSGIVHVMPLYSFFFLFFTMSNIALPGTSSFVGEFLLLLSVFQENTFCAIFASFSVVLSAAYSLWLYNRICFGNIKSEYLNLFYDISFREFIILLSLFLPSLYLGLFSFKFLNLIHFSVTKLFIISNVFNS